MQDPRKGSYEELSRIAGEKGASRLVRRFGSVEGVEKADDIEILTYPVIEKETRLNVMTQFGSRETAPQGLLSDPVRVDCPRDLFNLAANYVAELEREEAYFVLLDGPGYGSNATMVKRMGIGDENEVTFSTSSILWLAMHYQAPSFALFHNHPNGTCRASKQDVKATKAIQSSAWEHDLRLADHVIVAGRSPSRPPPRLNFLSMRTAGFIPDFVNR